MLHIEFKTNATNLKKENQKITQKSFKKIKITTYQRDYIYRKQYNVKAIKGSLHEEINGKV